MKRFLFAVSGILISSTILLWDLSGRPSQTTSTPSPIAEKEMKPYTETLPSSTVKFDMVPIHGGTFTMGSPATERGRAPDEGPQHKVKVHPFWMGKTEMTWEAFDLYAFNKNLSKGAEPATDASKGADAITRPTPPYSDPTFGYGRKGHPIISISHHAAMEFTRWLSEKTGKDYRLPTEAEWEYACRAGTTTPYDFGVTPGQLSQYAWFRLNSEDMPHAVALKKPNAWGLFDMDGNVAEWVLDRYDKDYYKQFDPATPADSPVLIPGAEHYPHVVRGGSWDDDAAKSRCAARRPSTKDWNQQDPQRPQSIWWLTDGLHVGFRIVRPLEEQENLKGLKSQVTP